MLNELFARKILETSIALGILQEINGGVVIYHEASKEDPENLPAGWYIDDKNYTAFSIATDPEAKVSGMTKEEFFEICGKLYE